jgi:hypothetical protein
MTHPRGIMTPGSSWRGPEVEGPMAPWRVQTAMISSPVAPAVLEVARVGHVFVRDTLRDWAWFRDTLAPWLELHRMPCTIECDATNKEDVLAATTAASLVRGAVVVARLRAHDSVLDLLRPDDLVSVGAPYNIVTFRVGSGWRTRPQDYLEDAVLR